MKRKFSALTLKDAMQLVGRNDVGAWPLDTPPRPPSSILENNLARLYSFDLRSSEQAKTLLIDLLLAEVVPQYRALKVWKAAPLSTDALVGVADYAIAPHRAYMDTPLLCVVEAKRDDFDAAQVQCVAEMYACAWNNRQAGHDVDVYGVISNGQVWAFLMLAQGGDVLQSRLFTIDDLADLLGALDYVCARCAEAVQIAAPSVAQSVMALPERAAS